MEGGLRQASRAGAACGPRCPCCLRTVVVVAVAAAGAQLRLMQLLQDLQHALLLVGRDCDAFQLLHSALPVTAAVGRGMRETPQEAAVVADPQWERRTLPRRLS